MANPRGKALGASAAKRRSPAQKTAAESTARGYNVSNRGRGAGRSDTPYIRPGGAAGNAAPAKQRNFGDDIGDFLQNSVDTVLGKKNRLTPKKPPGVIPRTQERINEIKKLRGGATKGSTATRKTRMT